MNAPVQARQRNEARLEGFFVGSIAGLLFGIVIMTIAYAVPW